MCFRRRTLYPRTCIGGVGPRLARYFDFVGLYFLFAVDYVRISSLASEVLNIVAGLDMAGCSQECPSHCSMTVKRRSPCRELSIHSVSQGSLPGRPCIHLLLLESDRLVANPIAWPASNGSISLRAGSSSHARLTSYYLLTEKETAIAHKINYVVWRQSRIQIPENA